MRSLIVLPVLLALTACATFEQHQNTAKLVVQYAVVKYGEQLPAAEHNARVARIKAIATDVKALASGETTLLALQDVVNQQLDKAGLSPADRLLANGLVQLIVEELQVRVGAGLLSPEQRVQVSTVLDWIISATALA